MISEGSLLQLTIENPELSLYIKLYVKVVEDCYYCTYCWMLFIQISKMVLFHAQQPAPGVKLLNSTHKFVLCLAVTSHYTLHGTSVVPNEQKNCRCMTYEFLFCCFEDSNEEKQKSAGLSKTGREWMTCKPPMRSHSFQRQWSLSASM